ncbi:AI-2E family transporter [Microbacterium sp. G2-8]|uniref:AI-2E family transporter n=1 Tax=Microbacterium sp. G2-8 TaxID=2842454 RepID=UPI001C8B08D9|nr:AI-2E family transporter [Microbacterium sp. G2-8]
MLLTRPIVTGFTVAIGIIIAVALAVAIASVSSVLMTVFFGLFLALGLDPAVGALERRRIPRGWGIAIVAVSFLLIVAVVVLLVVPPTIRQFAHLVVSAPAAIDAFQESEWFTSLESTLDTDLSAAIADSVRSFTNVSNFLAVSGGVLRAGFSVAGAISTGFMVVVLTLYFVSALPMMKEALARLQPAYGRERFSALVNQITTSVGGVVSGGITLSTLNAIAVFLLHLAIGSTVPALMALVAFFVTLVPMIGSLVFLVIGTVGALFISPWAAGAFLIGYFLYIQVEAYVLTPRILGRTAAVPAVLVITGAMIGAALLGLLGALIAVPITASILIIVRQVVVPQQDARVTAPER